MQNQTTSIDRLQNFLVNFAHHLGYDLLGLFAGKVSAVLFCKDCIRKIAVATKGH